MNETENFIIKCKRTTSVMDTKVRKIPQSTFLGIFNRLVFILLLLRLKYDYKNNSVKLFARFVNKNKKFILRCSTYLHNAILR